MQTQYSSYTNQELAEEVQAYVKLVQRLTTKVNEAIDELQKRSDTTSPTQLELF